jgi:hypothetical protein
MKKIPFALELQKPISYFFPDNLLKDWVMDVKTSFEHEMLEYARSIEAYGNPALTFNLLSVLQKHFDIEEEYARTGYHPDMDAADEKD